MATGRFQEFLENHKYLSSIGNLSINFGPIRNENTHPLEQVFYTNLFKELSRWKRFQEFDFFIIGATKPYNFRFNKKSIVFCLSNETHEIPKDIQSAGLIFSPYAPLRNEIQNCFPIPLGYNGSLYNLPLKKIQDRKYDVFFSGNIYKKRKGFYLGIKTHQLLTKFRKIKGSYHEHLQFNRKFTGGMDPKEYSEILMNTKIALVPEGYLSDISFRFFEAAKMGCIIITKELYDYWFFKEFPGIQMNNWMGLHKQIISILSDQKKLNQIQQLMLSYYNKFCSEEATARYVIKTIEKSKLIDNSTPKISFQPFQPL